jgi:formate dehydrogenase major subunit
MYVIGRGDRELGCERKELAGCDDRMEFLVVQDIFMSRTAEFADDVLPAAPMK